jgi:DNA-binding NarL/FixJ family response regulator
MHILLISDSVLGLGIRSTLEQQPDWHVTHTYPRNQQAIEAITAYTQQIQQDVTILEGTGTAMMVCEEVCAHLGHQGLRSYGMLVVVTHRPKYEDLLFQLQRLGVAAYLGEGTSADSLLDTVRRVSHGEYLMNGEGLSPTLSTDMALSPRTVQLMQDHLHMLAAPATEPNKMDVQRQSDACALSCRELDILTCIAVGQMNKEIARELRMTEHQVKSAITRIFSKLGVYNRTSAVVRALHQGWISMPPCPVHAEERVRSVA